MRIKKCIVPFINFENVKLDQLFIHNTFEMYHNDFDYDYEYNFNSSVYLENQIEHHVRLYGGCRFDDVEILPHENGPRYRWVKKNGIILYALDLYFIGIFQKYMARTELACAIAHYILYNELLNDTEHDAYLIYESSAKELYTEIPQDVIDYKHLWDVLFLNEVKQNSSKCASPKGMYQDSTTVPITESIDLHTTSSFTGAYSYIINKHAALKMVETYIDLPIDILLSQQLHLKICRLQRCPMYKLEEGHVSSIFNKDILNELQYLEKSYDDGQLFYNVIYTDKYKYKPIQYKEYNKAPDEWSFIICTDGVTNCMYHDTIVHSIDIQNIPRYEVIFVTENKDFKYERDKVRVECVESDKLNHITYKKNLGARVALYENLCILHDYIALGHVWYLYFSEFGNQWDVAVCKHVNTNGNRFSDWCVPHHPFYKKTQNMAPYDTPFTKYHVIMGTSFCVKKKVLLEYPFDEELVWGQEEDVVWTKLLYNNFVNVVMNEKSYLQFLKAKWEPQSS